MALRPIENALTPALERHKKAVKSPVPTAKPAAAAAKRSAAGAVARNDENSSPLTPKAAGEQTVEYVRSENLQPVPDPKTTIAGLAAELDSKDWIRACEALNDARRLAIHNSAQLLPFLEQVMTLIVKAMKSPRSALCKTSIMACGDIICSLGPSLLSSLGDKAVDNLLLQLLLKASQDKRFVCEEAEKALQTMATSVPPPILLKKLQIYAGHANLRVRAKAATALSKCISSTDAEAMKEFGLPVLLRLASDLLNDRLPEAREAARIVVASVYSVFSKEADDATGGRDGEPPSAAERWESFCFSALPPASAQAVAKVPAM